MERRPNVDVVFFVSFVLLVQDGVSACGFEQWSPG